MTGESESPFARWSRRKLTSRTAPNEQPPAEPETPALAVDGAPPPEDEVFDESTLADPETLNAGDDFTAYLGKNISSGLKRRALRRLWTTNPVLANLDGLNDYDDDYTTIGTPSGLLKTAYKAGRGYLSDPEPADGRQDAPSPERPASETVLAPADNGPEPAPIAALDAPVDTPSVPTGIDDGPQARDSGAAELTPPVPRRMRFKVTDA